MGANEFHEVGHSGVAPRPPLHLSGVKPGEGEKWIPSLRAPPQSHREAVTHVHRRVPILTLAEAGVTALSPVLRLRTNPPTESTVWAK